MSYVLIARRDVGAGIMALFDFLRFPPPSLRNPGPPWPTAPCPRCRGAALPLPAAGGRWRGHVVLRIVPSLFCSALPGGRASPGPAPREGDTADPDPRPRQRPWQARRRPSPPRPTAASPKLARQRATLGPGCAEREESENIKKKYIKSNHSQPGAPAGGGEGTGARTHPAPGKLGRRPAAGRAPAAIRRARSGRCAPASRPSPPR